MIHSTNEGLNMKHIILGTILGHVLITSLDYPTIYHGLSSFDSFSICIYQWWSEVRGRGGGFSFLLETGTYHKILSTFCYIFELYQIWNELTIFWSWSFLELSLNIYFWHRYCLANAINDNLRLKFVLCV